ncbi:VOC family protein [Amycolatopsis sp. NPDC088138]|uniref:VOC family protein n=1 Tax=Amycolatopsis sp. NPDC088138 TaxID=3363938 RepID=UPI0037FADF82
MACRIGELVLERVPDGSVEIGPRAGFGGPQPVIFFCRKDEPETGKSRLHIDLNPTDRDQDAELERLLGLGARPADPEGNEFCLLKGRLEPLGS